MSLTTETKVLLLKINGATAHRQVKIESVQNKGTIITFRMLGDFYLLSAPKSLQLWTHEKKYDLKAIGFSNHSLIGKIVGVHPVTAYDKTKFVEETL